MFCGKAYCFLTFEFGGSLYLTTTFEDEDVDITAPLMSNDDDNDDGPEVSDVNWNEDASAEHAAKIYGLYPDKLKLGG